jgi:hypothetical protein
MQLGATGFDGGSALGPTYLLVPTRYACRTAKRKPAPDTNQPLHILARRSDAHLASSVMQFSRTATRLLGMGISSGYSAIGFGWATRKVAL